jgi:NNP family nitrate/nitrite transporter-like MFS transporter
MVDHVKPVDTGTYVGPVQRNRSSISDWNPENEKFWESTGKYIARRNLNWSMFALHHGFAIWLIWSIVVTRLPQAGFHYTTDQLFQLVAMPGLIGSLARFPYGFMPAIVGGRNWTVIATALLFIPVLSLAYFVTQPETPFWLMLIVAATAGFGGGGFSGSMANMSFFYPARLKGTALGWNAGVGNLGVSVVQLLVPLLLGFGFISLYLTTPTGGGLYLQNAGLMWIPTLTVAVIGAYLFMNNLAVARASLKEQLVILKRKQNWVMSYIYISTFGSFIG